ncbi:MAG TPA: cysteine desulfurase-like protein [Polyangiaceae bacterium]|nr:cysteine desulfurase-like protein [Polyangiaceae bacterium]
MPKLDHAWVRNQFPSLGLTLSEQPVAFFDNPAGTQVPRRVIDAMGGYLLGANANTHGDFLTSQRTDAVIAQARQLSAAFVGARSSNEIVFGANMTTLTYSLSRALGRSWAAGDEVIVTDLDHDANISPWLELSERGIVVRRVPVQLRDGTLDLDSFQRLLSRKTRLVAVGYASNALGTINDVARIAQMAHSVGARIWVDAVHYGPHGPIDVQAIEADYLVCSAYKFFGPHLGILWGKESHLDELRASQVRPAPRTSPEKFETGTKNHEGLAGLVGAFSYLGELGGTPDLPAQGAAAARAGLLRAMQAIRGYELELGAQLLQGLTSVRGLRLYGLSNAADLERRVPTFGFTLDGKDNDDVSRSLAARGIFTWAGHHYALTLMDRLGLSESGGVVRVGAVHYNTPSEVERLVDALRVLSP